MSQSHSQMLVARVLLSVGLWFFFRDFLNAPNWGTWAVTVVCYLILTVGDFVRMQLAITISDLKRRR